MNFPSVIGGREQSFWGLHNGTMVQSGGTYGLGGLPRLSRVKYNNVNIEQPGLYQLFYCPCDFGKENSLFLSGPVKI